MMITVLSLSAFVIIRLFCFSLVRIFLAICSCLLCRVFVVLEFCICFSFLYAISLYPSCSILFCFLIAFSVPKCVLGHRNSKENSEKNVLVHLLVQIIQL
jgi:hypothetical protein